MTMNFAFKSKYGCIGALITLFLPYILPKCNGANSSKEDLGEDLSFHKENRKVVFASVTGTEGSNT